MVSINRFTEIELQKQDIHTLRDLARNIGVSSPTSQKKDDLIANMLAIITGEKLPEYRNINRGRPAKKAVDYAKSGYMLGIGKAASGFQQYDANKTETGVVCFENGTYMIKKLKFVSFPTDFAIDDSFVKKYKLKENDIVEYCRNDNDVELVKINNKNAKLAEDAKVLAFGIKEKNKNIKFVENFAQISKIVDELAAERHIVLLPMLDKNGTNINVTVLPISMGTDEHILNNFLLSVSIAQFYQTTQNVVFVAENFANVLAACKLANMSIAENLVNQISANLSNFVEAGGTFVGVVPNALESEISKMLHGYNFCK